MIIDIHNHLSKPGTLYSMPPETYIETMDEANVDKIIILGKDYGNLGDRQDNNLTDEELWEFLKKQPDRFIGFTAVHPDRDVQTNLDRVNRAVQDYGMRGIKLNPASGFYPNSEALYPVYERAQELRIPVVIHSGLKPPSEGSRLKYCRPEYIDDVVVDFPDLKIVIAHAGYPWVEETILVGLYAENVYVDISTLNQIEEVSGSAVILPTIKRLHESLGASKIVFGSDGIFNFEPLIRAVNSAEFLTDNDREKIFYKNTMAILESGSN